jgi:ABC-type antimicrobial peptide transport system permease subunit
MIVGYGLRIALAGVAAGEVGAKWLSRYLGTMRMASSSGDIWIYVLCGILLLVSAGVASFIPAQRASSVDPLRTLKCE